MVCIRFGHDWDPQCMVMDETLYGVQGKLQNFAVIYLGESGGHGCHLGGELIKVCIAYS